MPRGKRRDEEGLVVGQRRARVLPLVLVVSMVLVACSTSSDGTAATPDDRTTTASSGSTSIPPDERYQGPHAIDYTLTDADLPSGFTAYPQVTEPRRADEPPPPVDRGTGLCGIRNPADTSDPLDRIQVGYSKRTGGPFVYETVAVYGSAAEAADVFDSATGVFDACVTDGARQTPRLSGGVLEVGSLGEQAGAWQVEVLDPVVEPGQEVGMGDGGAGMGMGDAAMATGRFYVECSFSHRAIADPIVFPGADPASPITVPEGTHEHGEHGPGMVEGVLGHQHEFFGATTTSPATTTEDLLASTTTCGEEGDRTAYWTPTLFDHGEPVTAKRLRAWYGVAPGVDAADVRPLPNGLQLIAGDVLATEVQSTDIVGWTCGTDPQLARSTHPPDDCTDDEPLSLQLTFPSCWNGEDLSSTDHRAHLAYPTADGCPESHPVALPEITTVYDYGLAGDGHQLEMAMGGLAGAHGDVFVAWTGDRQATIIDRCIRTATDCGGGIGPQGLPAFAHAVAMRRGATFVMLAVASFDPIDEAFTIDMAKRAISRIPDA